MTHQLRIRISDEAYTILQARAAREGVSYGDILSAALLASGAPGPDVGALATQLEGLRSEVAAIKRVLTQTPPVRRHPRVLAWLPFLAP